MPDYILLHGDSLQVLKELDENSVDAVVTDPPYGLGKEPDANLVLKDWIEKGYHEIKSKGGFMGKEWDSFVPQPELWKEVYRVLKPGGHVLSFFGTRTYDWGVMAMRLAGFEIRDCIQWLYGSGFPKSYDIAKGLDKSLGLEREVVGTVKKEQSYGHEGNNCFGGDVDRGGIMNITVPASEQAKQWDGWGTALKPANEPIVLARKPLIGTVVENILKHGGGGINIDGCRIKKQEGDRAEYGRENVLEYPKESLALGKYNKNTPYVPDEAGRFPANVILDDEAGRILDEQTGILTTGAMKKSYKYSGGSGNSLGKPSGQTKQIHNANTIGASRFFYCAKTSQKERNAGIDLKSFPEVTAEHSRNDKCINCDKYILQSEGRDSKCECENPVRKHATFKGNVHPTVKPIALMQYLIRLITPPNGTVLDPFNGSGSTGCAAMLEGMIYIGIEREEEYIKISEARIEHYKKESEDKAEK